MEATGGREVAGGLLRKAGPGGRKGCPFGGEACN